MFSLVRRTPPGVRELKLVYHKVLTLLLMRRTPPGVRELKPDALDYEKALIAVAPLPGCVN